MNTDMMISLPTSSRCSASASVEEYSEPGKLVEAGKDMRIAGSGPYAVMPHPTDGSVWYTLDVFAGPPGFLRFDPKTKLSEFYTIPKRALACAAATSTRTAWCGARVQPVV